MRGALGAIGRGDGVTRLLPLLVVIVLLIAWEVGVRLSGVNEFVLVAPSRIWPALVQDAPLLIRGAWFTLKIMWIALALAFLIGVALAFAMYRSTLAQAALLPITVGLQVTPVMAIAPIILVWTGVEKPERALVLIAWIVAFFPIVTAMLTGLRTVPQELRDMFSLYRASSWQRFVKLEWPASLPSLMGGLKVASGLALIGAVVAEFCVSSGTSSGLAWTLIQATKTLEMPRAFACLVLLTAIGVVHYLVFGALEARVLQARGLNRDR
jgi:NitT/TauT family transport system permease protein